MPRSTSCTPGSMVATRRGVAEFERWSKLSGRDLAEGAFEEGRFRSRDELRYSLRSVWAFCRMGTEHLHRHRGPTARVACRPPACHGRRPRRHPPGRCAPDVQLPRDRVGAASNRRTGRAVRLLQRRRLPRPARSSRDVLHVQWAPPGLPERRSPRRATSTMRQPRRRHEQPNADDELLERAVRQSRRHQAVPHRIPLAPQRARGDRASSSPTS